MIHAGNDQDAALPVPFRSAAHTGSALARRLRNTTFSRVFVATSRPGTKSSAPTAGLPSKRARSLILQKSSASRSQDWRRLLAALRQQPLDW